MLRPPQSSASHRLLGMTLVLAVSAASAAAWAAQSSAAEVSLVSAPVWVKTPKGDDMTRVYPITARQQGLAGGATLTCRVDARGLLNTCTVANEAPARAGFGQAALALAPAFRMADTDEAGLATNGAQVAIPIRFVAPSLTGSRLRSVGY